MPSSFRFGKYFDVEVRIHITFVLFVLYWGYEGYMGASVAAQRWAAAWHSMASVCALFVCVVLHEYGHILMARRFGIGTRDILLLPIGGVARLERIPERNREEILVALAGPAVNVVIAAVLYATLTFSGVDIWAWNGDLMRSGFYIQLLLGNVAMVVFNMIPAFPMDGGRVLRALLGMAVGRVKATVWAMRVGRVLAICMALYGLTVGHYILVLAAVMVWIGAGHEAADTIRTAVLRHFTANGAAFRQFITFQHHATLRDVIQASGQTQQADFPVLEDEIIIGVLSYDHWTNAVRDGANHDVPLSQLRLHTWVRLTPEMDLAEAENLMQVNNSTMGCLLDQGRLVGILTPDIIRHFLALRDAGVPFREA